MSAEGANNKTLVERRAKLMNGLAGSDEKAKRLKTSMYMRYGELAQAMYSDPVKEGLIRGNKAAFSVLCDPTVYMWAFTGRSSDEFKDVSTKYPEIVKLFSTIQEVQKGVTKIAELTGESKVDISFDDFIIGLSSFKSDSIVPLMDDIETIDEDIDVNDDYFVDEEDDEEDKYIEDTEDILLDGENEDNTEELYSGGYEDELDPELESNTARVMNVYKDLFEVGFELQIPYGILVKEGILRLTKDGRTSIQKSSSLGKLYNLINDITRKFIVQSEINASIPANKLREVKIRQGTTYYPEFQLGNLFGILGETKVDSWEQLSNYIRPEIRHNIKANLEAGKDIASIVNALTTCIVVSEFNANISMKLRINIGNGLISKEAFEKEYISRKSTILAGTGELHYINQLQTGVIEVTLVFNKAAFNGRPLFAYEAVQDLIRRGRKPSLKEMIIGQNTSGKIMTVNFNRQNSCITLIGAGPRSGKGVLTLNLVGTILAGGHPLIYLDGKPDMAKVLWNVAGKNGINPAVWDAFYENGNTVGNGAPELIARENRDIFGVLMYLKAVQLMMAAAHLRATKGIMIGGTDKRPFFIFDEALAVQSTMAGAWRQIIGLAKEKKNDSEEARWCKGIVQWAEQLTNSLVSTMNSQLPKSGMSTVWLFQAVQPTSWNAFNTQGLSGDFNILKNPIMARTSIKLLGKGTTDSEYGLGNVNIKNNRIVAEYIASEGGRHFAYTEAQKITDMELIKIFKPYLVLNEAENGTDSVEELKNNVSREVWEAIAPNGSLHPAAGFEGFANLLGAQAIQNLALGRQFMNDLMQALGLSDRYGSIDEYLYDASIDSFRSLGTLVNGQEFTDDSNDTSAYVPGSFGNVLTKQDSAYPIGTTGYEPSISGTMDWGEGTRTIRSDKQLEIEREAREALENDTKIIEESKKLGQMTDEEIARVIEESRAEEELQRIIIERRNQISTEMKGKGGRINVIDTTQTSGAFRLNRENSIDCRNAGPGPLSWIERMTLDTPKGSQKYINKLWNSILDNIVSSGLKKAHITRVSIYGGQMYVNTKIVNLTGVVGGYECIRLRDIVSFKTLFKKFFMIRELRTDEEMLRAAMLELGDNAIEQFFRLAPRLEILIVQNENGINNSFDRSTVQSRTARRMMEKSRVANDIDLYCAANNQKSWAQNLSGDNIWGMKLAKNAMGSAGRAFMDKSRPRLGKAVVYSGVGLLVGTVGSVAWGATRVVKGLFSLGNMFRR